MPANRVRDRQSSTSSSLFRHVQTTDPTDRRKKVVRIVSWNTGQGSVPPTDSEEVWSWLLDMDADLALLQEARQPPEWAMRHAQERGNPIECDPGGEDMGGSGPAPWKIAGYSKKWRSTVVRLSDQVRLDWLPWKSFATTEFGQFRVSRHDRRRASSADSERFFRAVHRRVDVRSVGGSPSINPKQME